MRSPLLLAIAACAFGGARLARPVAEAMRSADPAQATPYAPSPDAAPLVTLGFREVAADLLFLRLKGYFGGTTDTGPGSASLVEAIIALDPRFHRIYEYGAWAIILADHGVDTAARLRALAVLGRGAAEFPDDWKLPFLAGQIYGQDLVTDDPAQRRRWDERAALLIETAIRKPHAPASAASYAAHLRTKLGQHQRAVDGLRELLLVTFDASARRNLIEQLAKLEDADADEIAGELLVSRKRFEAKWLAERPELPLSMYVLLGPLPPPGYDLADLATGGRDLYGSDLEERLEPLDDGPTPTPATSATGPRSP
jgi:hypothetical protein